MEIPQPTEVPLATPAPASHKKQWVVIGIIVAVFVVAFGIKAVVKNFVVVHKNRAEHCGSVNVSMQNFNSTGKIASGDVTCIQEKIRLCETGDGVANIDFGSSGGVGKFKILGGNTNSCKIQMHIESSNPIDWECQGPTSAWELINTNSKWEVSITKSSVERAGGHCIDLTTGQRI